MDRTVSLRITGQVQGVGFRAWMRATARDLGLDGWVRNEADGSVSALVQGPREAVTQMITALHGGPGAAEVTQVIAEDAPHEDVEGFDAVG